MKHLAPFLILLAGILWGCLGISDAISDKEIPAHRIIISEFLTMLFAFCLAFAD